MGLLYDYHVLLNFGFVKGMKGYVIKAESKPCHFIVLILSI